MPDIVIPKFNNSRSVNISAIDRALSLSPEYFLFNDNEVIDQDFFPPSSSSSSSFFPSSFPDSILFPDYSTESETIEPSASTASIKPLEPSKKESDEIFTQKTHVITNSFATQGFYHFVIALSIYGLSREFKKIIGKKFKIEKTSFVKKIKKIYDSTLKISTNKEKFKKVFLEKFLLLLPRILKGYKLNYLQSLVLRYLEKTFKENIENNKDKSDESIFSHEEVYIYKKIIEEEGRVDAFKNKILLIYSECINLYKNKEEFLDACKKRVNASVIKLLKKNQIITIEEIASLKKIFKSALSRNLDMQNK